MADEFSPSELKQYALMRTRLLQLLTDVRSSGQKGQQIEDSLNRWPYTAPEVKAEAARLGRVRTPEPDILTVADRVRGVRGRT